MGGLPDRRIDHRRRVIGSVGGDMHEQFVVQAQHDLGTEGRPRRRTVIAHTLKNSAAAPWITALRA